MGSLSFEPSDKDIEFVEELLKGINEYAKKDVSNSKTGGFNHEQQ